jgi:hypothetical protein
MLLLALAGLAERAGGRCHAVRCAVLWLLRPAETIVRDYVAALTGAPHPHSQPPILPAGDSHADATRLALAFRTLAAALVAFAEQMFTALQANLTHVRCAGPAQCAIGVTASLLVQLPAIERRDSS